MRAALAFVACTLGIASTTFAQSRPSMHYTGGGTCLDTVSMTGAKRWVGYIFASTPDSLPAPFPELADEFTQSVAQHLRALLHAHGDTLPPAEPAIGWRNFPEELVLIVHASRDSAPRFTLDAWNSSAPAAILLLRAAQESQATGDGALFWPQDAVQDSVSFRMGFWLSTDGSLSRARGVRYAFPVFTLMRPPETPASIAEQPDIHYPETARRIGGAGVVLIQFQVDSTGRVTPGTLREEWPPTQPRPTGELLAVYTDFLEAAMNGLPSARFNPARVGGCAVNQLVEQPFTFELTK